MARKATHYETLEVARSATLPVIRAAYKALSQKHHPDKNGPDKRELCEDRMRSINVAFETLSDLTKKQAYDAWIAQEELRTESEARLGTNHGGDECVEDEDAMILDDSELAYPGVDEEGAFSIPVGRGNWWQHPSNWRLLLATTWGCLLIIAAIAALLHEFRLAEQSLAIGLGLFGLWYLSPAYSRGKSNPSGSWSVGASGKSGRSTPVYSGRLFYPEWSGEHLDFSTFALRDGVVEFTATTTWNGAGCHFRGDASFDALVGDVRVFRSGRMKLIDCQTGKAWAGYATIQLAIECQQNSRLKLAGELHYSGEEYAFEGYLAV